MTVLTAAVLAGPVSAVRAAPQDLAVTVKDVEPFPYCAIAHKGPFTDLTEVIGRLVGAMQTQGLFPQVRGPLVGVYYDAPGEGVDPATLSWEVGFITTAQATPQPPLMKKSWGHRTVAIALHVGPYDRGGETIVKMMEWLEARGFEVVGPVLERYLDQNPMALNPEELRTEIWIPCRKK
jgi:effector-binding domain-containing protein